jgi:hypothetical protein
MSKKIDRPKCEPGYRYLNKGEIVRKGDGFVFTLDLGTDDAKCWSVVRTTVGKKVGGVECVNFTFRRKVEAKPVATPPAATPEVKAPETKPLPGYRLLQIGEKIMKGDECCHINGTFEASAYVGKAFRQGLLPVRRKIENIAPKQYRFLKAGEIFQEGDEWGGGHDATQFRPVLQRYLGEKVNVSDEMAKDCRRPITATASPASPAQKYRPLKEDEKLEAGDEIFGFMNSRAKAWAAINSRWVGDVVGSSGYKGWEYRRKVPADYKYEHPKVRPVDGMYCMPVVISDKTSRFYGVTGRAVAYNYPTDKKAYLVEYDMPQEKEGFTKGWFWENEVSLYKKPEPEYRFLKYGEVLLPTDEQVLGFQASDDKPIWGGISPVFFANKNLEFAVGEFDAKFKKFRRKVE